MLARWTAKFARSIHGWVRPAAAPCRRAGGRRLTLEVLEDRVVLSTMTNGPLVGGVTDQSANVWARTDGSAAVAVQYSTDPTMAGALTTAPVQTAAAHDFTAIVPLAGLRPLTRYYYRILVDGQPQETTNYPTFVSFPRAGAPTDFTFGAISDQESVNQYPGQGAPAFAQLAGANPAFVLQTGDFDHRNPTSLALMRTMHRQLIDPSFVAGQQFITSIAHNFPFDHIWSDHDFGDNNSDGTFPNRLAALQSYKEYYPTYDLPGGGIQHQFTYGNADFFMLDTRSLRAPDFQPDNAGKSMLGHAQLQWLESGLLNSTATWKFIASDVPFNQTARTDGWSMYSTEWKQLTNFIIQHHIRGVIALSGDLHSLGGIDNRTNSGIPELSIPYTNLFQGRSSEVVGSWSNGVKVGNNSGGYSLVHVLTGPDRVVLENYDQAGNLVNSYTVTPEAFTQPATHLGVSTELNALQGQKITVALTALDAHDGWATGYRGTVHFSSDDPNAVLPADYTFTAGDASRHFFTITYPDAGPHTLTVTDVRNPGITGRALTASHTSATQLSLSGPTSVVAGQPFQLTVTGLNADGSRNFYYEDQLHWAGSDLKGILPSNRFLVPDDAGRFTYSMQLGTPGVQTITVTDLNNPALHLTRTITVLPAVAGEHFAVSIAAATLTAGQVTDVTVTALDAAGNVDPTYRGTVRFLSTDTVDPAHILPGTYAFTAADQGRHTFVGQLAFVQSGWRMLGVVDNSHTTIFGSASVLVNPAPAVAWFAVYGAATAGMGRPLTLTVVATDEYNNRITNFAGTVRFSSSDPGAILPANYTFTKADQGRHVFTVTPGRAGARVYAVVSTLNSAILGTLQADVT